jgi:hypothetical protein
MVQLQAIDIQLPTPAQHSEHSLGFARSLGPPIAQSPRCWVGAHRASCRLRREQGSRGEAASAAWPQAAQQEDNLPSAPRQLAAAPQNLLSASPCTPPEVGQWNHHFLLRCSGGRCCCRSWPCTAADQLRQALRRDGRQEVGQHARCAALPPKLKVEAQAVKGGRRAYGGGCREQVQRRQSAVGCAALPGPTAAVAC